MRRRPTLKSRFLKTNEGGCGPRCRRLCSRYWGDLYHPYAINLLMCEPIEPLNRVPDFARGI